jgi:hypothetical protein
MFMVSACVRGEQDIILAPANFKGGILILFNQKSGKPTRYHDGKRLYEIPPDGILKTQFARNHGWREFTIFYRGRISEANRLKTYAEHRGVPNNIIVGYMGPTGTQQKKLNSKDRYEFAELYICTKSEIDSLKNKIEMIDLSKIGE